MMDNIVDILKREPMQEEPTPTENAQVMVMYDVPVQPLIFRFNKAKDGRKAYDAMVKAWNTRARWAADKEPPQIFEVKSDIFDGHVDLDRVISINFVEWPKRGKFFPRMA